MEFSLFKEIYEKLLSRIFSYFFVCYVWLLTEQIIFKMAYCRSQGGQLQQEKRNYPGIQELQTFNALFHSRKSLIDSC
jgi:hypothetical protein